MLGTLSVPSRLMIGAALAVLLLAAGIIASDAAGSDRDLEAGLANLRAGNDDLATEYLTRYSQRQADPDIKRQVDLTLGQVNQLGQSLTRDERERAARRLEDIVQNRTSGKSRFALEWRFRNFPVFP